MSRVLLVEDDADVATTILGTFGLYGIEAVHAETVDRALDELDGSTGDPFAVVVLDYELPDGTGLDVADAIELIDWTTENRPTGDPPLVILHSGLDRSAELAASGAKVDLQISKTRPDELLAAIRTAVFVS